MNSLLQDVACTDDHFPIDPFIKRLNALMYHKSVNVRLLALNWFEALDGEPDIYMLTFLPLFLNALFMMLIDQYPILRNQAQIVMHDLCNEIDLYLKKDELEISTEERFDIELIVNNLVTIITSSDRDLQLQQQRIFGNGTNNTNGTVSDGLDARNQLNQTNAVTSSVGNSQNDAAIAAAMAVNGTGAVRSNNSNNTNNIGADLNVAVTGKGRINEGMNKNGAANASQARKFCVFVVFLRHFPLFSLLLVWIDLIRLRKCVSAQLIGIYSYLCGVLIWFFGF